MSLKKWLLDRKISKCQVSLDKAMSEYLNDNHIRVSMMGSDIDEDLEYLVWAQGERLGSIAIELADLLCKRAEASGISLERKYIERLEAAKTEMPPLHEASDECNETMLELETLCDEMTKARSVDVPTTEDLIQPMRQKMEEEDPSLAGDLAYLLHQLGDPENNKISLIWLAGQISLNMLGNPKLVAQALDRLVEDFRETLSSSQNFEMSDKDCLVAMDALRGTVHDGEIKPALGI